MPDRLEGRRIEATMPPDAERRAPWGRFLLAWVVSSTLLLVAVAAVNVTVDPYFVFDSPLVSGFNRYKPKTAGRETYAKPTLLRAAHPRTLLMGTSKVQVGLDPESPAWADVDRPVFNLGRPDDTLRQTLRILSDAVAVAPVQRVLLVVEPFDLLQPPFPPAPVAPLFRTGWARAQELLEAALTLDALEASLYTIVAQQTELSSGLRPNGQMYDGIFRGPTRAEGPGNLFHQKMILNAAQVADIASRLRAWPDAGFAEMDTLREIVAFCLERGIALDIALPPLHAEFLRLLDLAGLWSRYLSMRAALAAMVARAGDGQVRLWSFTGFNGYSEEPVPPVGHHPPALRWFWEPNHFRPELGELMLETIYRGRKGVGTLLTPQDVAASNRAQTAALDADRAAQPAEWARAAEGLSRAKDVFAAGTTCCGAPGGSGKGTR